MIKAHLLAFNQVDHVKEARKMEDVPAGQQSAGDSAATILNILGTDGLMEDDYVEPEDFVPELKQFLGDQAFYFEFLAVHGGKKATAPVMMQPDVLSMMAEISCEIPSLVESEGKANGRVSIESLLGLMADKVYSIFDERWATFGAELLKVCAQDAMESDAAKTPANISAGLFENWSDVDACFKRRTFLVLNLVKKLMTGGDRYTLHDAGPAASALSDNLSMLASCDLRISRSNFVAFWSSLLTTKDPAQIPPVLKLTLKSQSPTKKASGTDTGDTGMDISDSQDFLFGELR